MTNANDRQPTLEMVDISSIAERPGLRNTSDDLSTLEKSIRDLGLLSPVLINAENVLLAGYRRLEACRRLGMKTIPALRIDVDENSLRALDVLIQENLCRRDLNADELETLIGRKKDLLSRLHRRGSLRKMIDWLRSRGRPASNPS